MGVNLSEEKKKEVETSTIRMQPRIVTVHIFLTSSVFGKFAILLAPYTVVVLSLQQV